MEKLIGKAIMMILAFLIIPFHAVAFSTVEQQTDRMGSDISRTSNINAPSTCRRMCDAEPSCSAYTWVKPGVQESGGVCYLKNPVPSATYNDCCVSGVKQSVDYEQIPDVSRHHRSTTEHNTDRMGSDISRTSNINAPSTCRRMCDAEPSCSAYTWVKPGVQESGGVCYLKNPVPPATYNDCCVSGVK